MSDTDLKTWLKVRRLGIDTHQEPVVYLRRDCNVCRSEGFSAHTRVKIIADGHSTVATVNTVSDDFLSHEEAGLSDAAWEHLGVPEGTTVHIHHAPPADSLSFVRGKIYGQDLSAGHAEAIIKDVTQGLYSDIQLSAFLTACAGSRLNTHEIIHLTQAMVHSGTRLSWGNGPVFDKHCVGGLPGNRTTPIVVAIVAAAGLRIPKTSSRAITSPAGTADTMETLTTVELTVEQMRDVVEREGGCMAWGGSVSLSPADDILIRVERALDLDSEGQLVASVLSKKVAAGSTHVLLDLPIGPTAKVRSRNYAERLAKHLRTTGKVLGLQVHCHFSDGSQPVGRGIGPALEARDLLAVFQNQENAPADLRERGLVLAGLLLEMGDKAQPGRGMRMAKEILESGKAWEKFKAICEAQGGLKEPPTAAHTSTLTATRNGIVGYLNNRVIAKVAKLAGAPAAPAAGLELHVHLGEKVSAGAPLLTVHAETEGELSYAMEFLQDHPSLIRIEEEGL
ncbi:thymidine phosphorylase family protein [Marinobacteraceae bacterium S3BR75-40.1]